jgi:hypothetical protein
MGISGYLQSKTIRKGTIYACLVLSMGGMPSGANSEQVKFNENWGEPGYNIVEHNSDGVELIYSLPGFNIRNIEIKGETYQTITIPGAILPNRAGAPNLPYTGRFLAIPHDAEVEIEILAYQSEVFPDLDIAPAFRIPVDGELTPLQYEKDPAVYNEKAYYPDEPVTLVEQSQLRGMDVALVGVTPFQYNPVTRELVAYSDIRFRINFHGGSHQFGDDRLRSRWFEPILKQNLLNYEFLPPANFPRPGISDETGYEYLIITPDEPEFIAWADSIKRWRCEQGIVSGVVTLSEIGGNDTTLIRNFIRTAYNNWDIPPVGILLLSDYQESGDQYGISSPIYWDYASDNSYVDISGNLLPDICISRIPARNEYELQTIIGKMFEYERNPCLDETFYQAPVVAGGFQPECWFILCCEVIAGYFDSVLNRNPVREYAIYNGTPGSVWSTNPNTWMILEYFGPEGLGYIPETMDYLTDWGGTARRLNADINSGCFIVQHRDHGSLTGWSEPSYHIGDLRDLNNIYYPYVFSMNCSTGKFNYPTQCFAEAFLRSQYGALGVMAASGTVYSFVNDTYTWGVYDAMWPDFDPLYGYDDNRGWTLRPGFGNMGGKYYLAASSWPINPETSHLTYQLFHHFGGAFMTLYSEMPMELSVAHRSTISPSATSFSVSADEGSFIGLSVNGEVVGAAEGTGTFVSIPISSLTGDQSLRVTVTKPNYFRYIADVMINLDGTDGGEINAPIQETDENKNPPDHFAVISNHPNPFNPKTVIRFQLPEASRVILEVFDLNGRLVTSGMGSMPSRELFPPGTHEITFDGSGSASGVYIYRISANGLESGRKYLEAGKMLLLK